MIEYLFPALGYLLGSVSTAVVVARLMKLEDPRTVGSRNPGATNILRYGGKLPAALTLMGDALKGVIPVLIARAFTAEPIILALTGLLAFLGHLYPVFFGFRGGKGVATALGVWLALSPWVALALITTWLAMAAVFRYSSSAAVTAAALAPVYVWWIFPGQPRYVAVSVMMSVLLIWRHRANIRKLLAGGEGKIGRPAS